MADPIPLKSPRRRAPIALHRLDHLPERPPREEVVEGLIAVGEIVAVVAPAGDGKSALVQLLITCIAEGRHFLGRKVMSGPAIYVAAERYAEASRRLLAIRRRKAPLYIAKSRPNLADVVQVEELAERIKQVCEDERSCPVLVVIDTLARCMPGLDENSARDMGTVIEGLTRLAEQVPSAAILFVHHAGKNGSEMRGSTALIGGVDLELRVEGRGKDAGKRLVVNKANSVSEEQTLHFRLAPVEYRDAPNADAESVIAAVHDEDGALDQQVIPDTGPSRDERVLSLISEKATGSVADRRSCLASAREQGLIEGKTASSTAEQFRKILVRLRDAGLVTFDEKQIALGSVATPNRPNGPP